MATSNITEELRSVLLKKAFDSGYDSVLIKDGQLIFDRIQISRSGIRLFNGLVELIEFEIEGADLARGDVITFRINEGRMGFDLR